MNFTFVSHYGSGWLVVFTGYVDVCTALYHVTYAYASMSTCQPHRRTVPGAKLTRVAVLHRPPGDIRFYPTESNILWSYLNPRIKVTFGALRVSDG